MRPKDILEKVRAEKYYTSKDLMNAFGVSSFTLSRWVNDDVIPDFPYPIVFSARPAPNSKWYWEKDVIKEWLLKHPELTSCCALPD